MIIVISIIIFILIAICLSVALFYNSKLDKINYNFDSEIKIDTELEIVDKENEQPDLSYLPQAEPDFRITKPEGEIYKNSDVINILLLGTDDRTSELSENARADSMMILSINKKNKTAKLISLERAIGVPIEGRDADWLTHTFRYGGPYLTLQTVRECLLLDINKYVRVNFKTFTQIIDTVGGVDVTLTQAEVNALNLQLTDRKLIVGENHLNSETTLAYSRLRKIDSDWQRIQRQRTVLQAVANKTKDLSILELNTLADNVLPLIETNLTKNEITSLLVEIPNFAGVQLEQMTIPQKDTYMCYKNDSGRSLFAIDFVENSNILRKFIYE